MAEFVEVKTAELVGPALDWAVAQIEGQKYIAKHITKTSLNLAGKVIAVEHTANYSPSTDWALGGPLIERELIEVSPRWHNQHCAVNQDWEKRGFKADPGWHWAAYVLGADNIDDNHEQEGGAPLIAAMRCIVAAKLGDVVQAPAELVRGSEITRP